MSAFVRVASLADLPPGRLAPVDVDGEEVCLANAGGTVYAFRNVCSHEDEPLHSGDLDGTRVECAAHGARFDVATGRAVSLPAVVPIRTFEVRIEGDDILVAV